jgi:hypothetical protein
LYEIKLNGHPMMAAKANKQVALISHRRNSLNAKFPYVVKALDHLPDGTAIDTELVALDEQGRSNLNRMQNYRSYAAGINFFRVRHSLPSKPRFVSGFLWQSERTPHPCKDFLRLLKSTALSENQRPGNYLTTPQNH